MLSRPLVSYVLTAALRDRLLATLLLMIAAGAGLGVFLGSAAVTEQESFSTVFGAGGLRFLGITGVVLFVSFYMRRAFDSKEVEFMLSRPISRLSYLFSHAFAFIVLSTAIALAITLVLMLTGKPHPTGLLIWGISVIGEYAVIAVAALFFSIVLSSAAGSALATLGLYALARMIGILLGITHQPAENILFAVLNNVVELVSVVIPRLDLMAQTSWLVYGVEGAGGLALRSGASDFAVRLSDVLGVGGFVTVQSLLFVALLLLASAFDFMRREF